MEEAAGWLAGKKNGEKTSKELWPPETKRAMEDHCQPLVDIMVEDADTSEAVKLDMLYLEVRYASYSILYYHCLWPVHYSASKRSTVQEVTTNIPKNLSVSKEGLLCSINHLETLTMRYLG